VGLCLAAVMIVAPVHKAHAQASASEYKLKAAYLYHFSQFVEWPESAQTGAFHVCVLGENPFGDGLLALEKRKNARQQTFEIHYPHSAEQAQHCHILYLGLGQGSALAGMLAQLRDAPVLTVSSLPAFVDRGGMIGFVIESGKVRLEINASAARQAKLKMSAKLMEVARRVLDPAEKVAP
jgi:hypothetical protein